MTPCWPEAVRRLPWTSKMNKVLTAVLPIRLRDAYLRRVGVYNSMDEFSGH
jgi:hypothetical protein